MGGGRKKGPPALTYAQWLQWLSTSGLIPPGLADVAAEIATKAMQDSFIGVANRDLGEAGLRCDVQGQSRDRAEPPQPTVGQRRLDDGAGVEPFARQTTPQNVVGSMTRFHDDDGSSDDSDSPQRPDGMKEHLLG